MKDHLAQVPNKDVGTCPSVPLDVRESLEIWRRKRLGVPEEEVSTAMGGQEEAGSSQAAVAKRARGRDTGSDFSSTSVSGVHARRTPLPGDVSHSQDTPPINTVQRASIQAGFQKQAIAEATRELTRMFIRCAIPFHVAKTNQWRKTMRTISGIGCEWDGPTSEALRTRELKREKSCIEVQLEPLKETWKKYGCTILCDGWSDVRRRNVYNVLVSCCKGTMFLKAIDASLPGLTVTGAFIWTHIREAIEQIGPENVVQVVTDNGSNCKSMGSMLEDEFPAIVWTPCASHSLDLLIEDIGQIQWVEAIFRTGRSMVRFVKKRPKVLSMYRAYSTLELLQPAATRFAYMFIVLERLLRVRRELVRTVYSNEWLEWDERESPKARAFVHNVMREEWWEEVEGLLQTLNPIYTVLRITDMEGSTIGLLYEYMDKIGEALNKQDYLRAEK